MIHLPRQLFAVLGLILAVALTAGCTAEAKKQRHLGRADRYYQAHEYQKAEVEYMNVLQLDRANPLAIARLGTIYYEQGRLSRAYVFLTKAVELTPGDPDARLKIATIDLVAGKVQEARATAVSLLDQNPTNAEATLLLAESATTAKDLPEVRQRLEKLSAQLGETAPVQLALGRLHLRERDIKAAEAAVKRALALDSKFSAAYSVQGSICLAQNDQKGADAAFKAAAELSPVRSVRRLAYADFKIKTGELEEGKRLLAEISKQAPDYLPAWIRQAEIALVENKYPDCASLLNQALSRDDINFEALLLSGRLALVRRDAPKALAEFERMTRYYDRSPQAHYHLALAQLLNNDATKAGRSLERAVVLNPDFTEAILVLAELNIRKGNAVPAIAALTRLVKQQPQIAQTHLLLANAYLAQKKLDEAVAVIRRMMPLFPKSPQIPFLLGTALMEQKQLPAARQAFERALELSPDYIPALERLVDLDLLDKQYAAATQRVKQLMEHTPAAAEPWLLLAKIQLAQDATEPAEAALLKAVELNPNLRNPYLLLARLYLGSNRQQQALERLNILAAKRTNDVATLMQIGMIYDGLKDYAAASDAYEKALAVNPNFSPALNNLAYLLSEHLGQLDRAYETARRARDLQPGDPSAADTLGWILYRRGDYQRALGLLLESAEKLPAEPEIQFHLGMTCYMLGQAGPARTALQRAIQDGKDFPAKEEGRARLTRLAINVQTADAAVLKELEKALESQPDDPVVLGLVAAIYERDGAIDQAVNSYQRAIRQNPANVTAALGLVRLYSGPLKAPQKAVEYAKEAHNLAPEDPQISATLGRLVYQTGDYKWALSLLQEAARKLSGDAELLYDLAWAYYRAGQATEAEATMQEAVQMEGAFARRDDARRFVLLLAAIKTPDQTRAAAAQVQPILSADPNYLPALMVSAALQVQEGKLDDAKRLYEKILAANPLFLPATRNLAVLYTRLGSDDPKAYDLATKSRMAFPEDAEVARTLGILACRKGDYPRAVTLLKEAAPRRAEDAELYFYLGMAQYRLKKPAESKAALQRALELNVQPKLADEARRVLVELK